MPVSKVELEYDTDEGTLLITADHYQMGVKLDDPRQIKGWINLFESLGVEVHVWYDDEEEESKTHDD